MDENRAAAITYNETSGVRPFKTANETEDAAKRRLSDARENIAEIAFKRDGSGMAPDTPPSDADLAYPPGLAAWNDCKVAAGIAKGKDCGTCKHFVIWPSDDGKVPTELPRIPSDTDWPYIEKAKIKAVHGPFKVPAQVGDVPAGSNIYLFIYCGVA